MIRASMRSDLVETRQIFYSLLSSSSTIEEIQAPQRSNNKYDNVSKFAVLDKYRVPCLSLFGLDLARLHETFTRFPRTRNVTGSPLTLSSRIFFLSSSSFQELEHMVFGFLDRVRCTPLMGPSHEVN
ncbi:hypothetical protein OIU78_021107 [Salix suchowensis]|nr:hypothetical protein OIU78_021107 [Salix suchowensis]